MRRITLAASTRRCRDHVRSQIDLLTAATEGALEPVDVNSIRESIQKRYADVAGSTAGRFAYETGRVGALALGYEKAVLRHAG